MPKRCQWVPENDHLYQVYHDKEWGTPVHDDGRLFEFLILEGFQAGLSWRTILQKRENFRLALDGFDYRKIARYDEAKIAELLQNKGIVRNRLKVRATVTNAKAFLIVQAQYQSFDSYIWDFVDGVPIRNRWQRMSQVPASTKLSDRISKDLKKRGFKFVGTTIVYAFMQAVGMVNDHTLDCFRYKEIMVS
jgi:DNA-3-methyladenine glycosylase I